MKKKGMLFVIVVVLLAVVTGMIWNFRNKGTNYLYDQLELAQRYLLEQDYEKALVEFDQIIEIDPANMEAYIGKAEAYLGLKRYEDAIAAYQTVLEIDANVDGISESLEQMQLQYAMTLDEDREYDEAIEIYTLLLETDPKQAELYLRLAKAYYLSENEKQAVDVLQLGWTRTGDKSLEDQLFIWGYGKAEWKVKRIDRSIKNENGEIIADIYYDLVYTDNKKESSQKINEFLEQKADEFVEQEENSREETISELGMGYASSEFPYKACTDAEIVYEDEKYLSVRWTNHLYWGGVYNIEHNGAVFSLETGELMELQEIFDLPQNVLTAYLKFVVTEYMSDHSADSLANDGTLIYWNDNAYEIIMGYKLQDFTFYLRDGSPVLCFETYQLSYGAAGSFEIPCGLNIDRVGETRMEDLNGRWVGADNANQFTYSMNFQENGQIQYILGWGILWQREIPGDIGMIYNGSYDIQSWDLSDAHGKMKLQMEEMETSAEYTNNGLFEIVFLEDDVIAIFKSNGTAMNEVDSAGGMLVLGKSSSELWMQ